MVSNKLKILYLQEYPIYVTSEQGLDASAKVSIQTAATNIYGVDSLFFLGGSLASGKLKVMLLYQFVPAIRHILPCLQLH